MLRRFVGAAPANDLVWDRVVLRPPHADGYERWLAAMRDSEDHLKPWQPRWPADHLTRTAFRRRVSIYDAERARGVGFAWHVFDREDGRFLGACRLAPVRWGSARSGALGYWIARAETGRGVATASVEAVCHDAFARLGLCRVEAACVPENHASARVLQKAGFEEEGFAKGYLEIDGQRRDHRLFARLAP